MNTPWLARTPPALPKGQITVNAFLTGEVAENAISKVAGIVDALLAETPGSTGLHLVVALRAGDGYSIVSERSWGDPAGWRNRFDEVARAKTALSARTGLSTRDAQFLRPAVLRAGDVMWWGNAVDGDVIVSCSGLQTRRSPWR
jgi:hypothetical protein